MKDVNPLIFPLVSRDSIDQYSNPHIPINLKKDIPKPLNQQWESEGNSEAGMDSTEGALSYKSSTMDSILQVLTSLYGFHFGRTR